jgi:hypothetical protein
MNFDADRLSRLSGLNTIEKTGVITETVALDDEEIVTETDADLEESSCGLGEDAEGTLFELADDHEDAVEEVEEGFAADLLNPVSAAGHWRDRLFGKVDKDSDDSAGPSDLDQRKDGIAILLGHEDYADAGSTVQGMIDAMLRDNEQAEVEESTSLTMETLRETVLELRDEILAENEAEQQTLAEAPVRVAIRKEIKALLAEMPIDAAANWMYGSKGKPSQNGEKSRATTLLGIGFENSKN